MYFSNSLLRIDSSDIGQYLVGLLLSDDFGIGTTDDSFHEFGQTPVLMLKLKIMEIGLAMLTAISLSIRPEILSGPEALEVSIDFSNTLGTEEVFRAFMAATIHVHRRQRWKLCIEIISKKGV